MEEGKVKWFKGNFGFIERSDGKDVFVHQTAISMDGYRTLAEGTPVRFDVIDGDKGLQAANVTILDNIPS